MIRELQEAKTPAAKLVWAERWAEVLSGRDALLKMAQAKPERPAGRRSYDALRRLAS